MAADPDARMRDIQPRQESHVPLNWAQCHTRPVLMIPGPTELPFPVIQAMNQPPTDKGMNEPGMPMKGQPNIAELQKEIAKQAADQNLAEAAKSGLKVASRVRLGPSPILRSPPARTSPPYRSTKGFSGSTVPVRVPLAAM